MVRETKIAKENVEAVEILTMEKYKDLMRKTNKVHKQTCQRWLEFLKRWSKLDCIDNLKECNCRGCKAIKDKIVDLKQTIKIYEDAGI